MIDHTGLLDLTPEVLDRRRFLRLAGGAAAAGACLPAGVYAASSVFTGKVVKYTSKALTKAPGELNEKQVKEALEESLAALFGERTGESVWRKLFKPTDVVGVKVNCLGGPNLSTNPTLVMAVVEGIRAAGVKPANIVIFDRRDDELLKGGFEFNRGGTDVQCYGTGTNYDSLLTQRGQVTSKLSKILSTTCTAIVNMPILKDHKIAGITAAMKNHLGCIDNPNRYHRNAGDPYVADVYSIPQVRGKERLIVCDATKACFDGGPEFSTEEKLFFPNTLLIGKDAVALDYIAYRMISLEREKRNLPSLKDAKRQPTYLVTAAKHGLGIRDPRRTELIELPKA